MTRDKQEPISSGSVIKRFSKMGPRKLNTAECVNCGCEVNPGFAYTGSVLQGVAFLTRNRLALTPVIGVIQTWEKTYVIGGQTINLPTRIPFWPRRKGFLCDPCSSDPGCVIKTNRDGTQTKVRRVEVDARPGFIRESAVTGESKRDSVRMDIR